MTASAVALPGALADEGDPHRWLIAIAATLASLMQVIDTSIVNVAIPHMMGELGASIDEIAWVSTGYIRASVIIIPMTAWPRSSSGASCRGSAVAPCSPRHRR